MHSTLRASGSGLALWFASVIGASAASIVEIRASADVVDYYHAAGVTLPAWTNPPPLNSAWWQFLPSGAMYYSGPYDAEFEVSFDREAAPVAAGDGFKVFAGLDARLRLGDQAVTLSQPTLSISRSDSEGDFYSEFPFPYHFSAVGPDGSVFSLFGGEEPFLKPTLTLPAQAFGYTGLSPIWDGYLPATDGSWYVHIRDMDTRIVGAGTGPGGPITTVPDAASTVALLGLAMAGLGWARRRSA